MARHVSHLRVPATGGTVVRSLLYEVQGRLIVLSGRELEIECSPGCVSMSMAGIAVDIELRLDGPGGGWLHLRGRVTHAREVAHRLVIAIAEIPPEFAGVIEANLAERGWHPPVAPDGLKA